jgi:isoleucyl-tRNA synthetase
MRAAAATRELLHVERLTTALYARQARARYESTPFILHDGPPYANGELHMGHLMNKSLKDIVNRHHLLSGRRIRFVPGWDCHGLPIELKALSERTSKDPATPEEIRRIARRCAQTAAASQAADFRRWGVLADWNAVSDRLSPSNDVAVARRAATRDAYFTMDAAYEAEQLRVLASMIEAGCVYRAFKPVYWSPATRTYVSVRRTGQGSLLVGCVAQNSTLFFQQGVGRGGA